MSDPSEPWTTRAISTRVFIMTKFPTLSNLLSRYESTYNVTQVEYTSKQKPCQLQWSGWNQGKTSNILRFYEYICIVQWFTASCPQSLYHPIKGPSTPTTSTLSFIPTHTHNQSSVPRTVRSFHIHIGAPLARLDGEHGGESEDVEICIGLCGNSAEGG